MVGSRGVFPLRDLGVLLRSLEEGCEALRSLPGRSGRVFYLDEGDIPCLLVGDLHGESGLLPRVEGLADRVGARRLVFLGDYVDRGSDGLGVLLWLCDRLLRRGDVVPLRGNHEDRLMNLHDGFARELMWRFGDDWVEVYAAVEGLYGAMPMACVLRGELVALHGGACVPPLSLEELEGLEEEDPRFFQLLWNDPLDEDYVYRGGGTRAFDEEDLRLFLEGLGCRFLVRSHQRCRRGYKVFAERCLTVMTATYGGVGPSCAFLYRRGLDRLEEGVLRV